MEFFQKFGMEEDYIRKHYEEWKLDKEGATPKDFLWYTFQSIINAIAEQAASEEQMYQLNYDTYFKMWQFLVSVEKRNANHITRLMYENQFRLWKAKGGVFKKEVVLIMKGCCDYCDSLNGLRVSIDDAIKNIYLGSVNCTHKLGCNCTCSAENCRDENGRLIRVDS